MTDKNPTKAEIQADLDEALEKQELLTEERNILANQQADTEARLARMEALIEEQKAGGEYAGPEPQVYHDPFASTNPHKILSHPEGYRLGWKNPRIRDDSGWQGWEAITWDSEVGRDIEKYISSPPSKLKGIETQDNYVRRGTDSILSQLPEEIYLARTQARESKALRKQLAANATANRSLGEGVVTIGDGVTSESRGYGVGAVRAPEGTVRKRMLPTKE